MSAPHGSGSVRRGTPRKRKKEVYDPYPRMVSGFSVKHPPFSIQCILGPKLPEPPPGMTQAYYTAHTYTAKVHILSRWLKTEIDAWVRHCIQNARKRHASSRAFECWMRALGPCFDLEMDAFLRRCVTESVKSAKRDPLT